MESLTAWMAEMSLNANVRQYCKFSYIFNRVSLNVSISSSASGFVLCGSGMFKCGDGRCVSPGKICDGKFDCIDAADERDCGELCHCRISCRTELLTISDLCKPSEWRCEGGECIAKDRRCDGLR